MPIHKVEVNCPGCNAPWSTADKVCKYCGRQVLLTSMSDMVGTSAAVAKENLRAAQAVTREVEDGVALLSAGVCCLKLRVFDRAQTFLDRAAESMFDDPEVYFFIALAVLKGRKPFVTPLASIRQIHSLLNAAASLATNPVHTLLSAFIASDFYERKRLVPPRSSSDLYRQAVDEGLTQFDLELLSELLGMPVTI